ncbi:ornithine acetyltransferase [Achromatium sp. WMS2]|nr:ornithine acetyltransferase [Achromatium sp. WMS2]
MFTPITVYPIHGIRLGTAAAGIKNPNRKDRPDVAIIEIAANSNVAALFTTNAFCAAPVIVAKKHLNSSNTKYLLINSGNANAGTGQDGINRTLACCQVLADLTDSVVEQILPFSTGVIGEPLPVTRLTAALPVALTALDTNFWQQAAAAIMTTDKVAKITSRQFTINGHTASITGIAKGAGMIQPNMATLLAYVGTDLALSPQVLKYCLTNAIQPTLNSITVDGDTSTNDACVLIATGTSTHPIITEQNSDACQEFTTVLTSIFMDLALAIVRDGEGATKLVTITVSGAQNTAEAQRVGFAIANSPLVKTALFASDPNWGRILAAVGRSGIEDLNIDQVDIFLDAVCIVRAGARAPEYTEQAGQEVFQQPEFSIKVILNRGPCTRTIFTCDLSYEYVRINAEYRT